MKKILITEPPLDFHPNWISRYWVGIKIELINQKNGVYGEGGRFSIDPKTGKTYLGTRFAVNAYDALKELYSNIKLPDTVKKWYDKRGYIYTIDSRGKPEACWFFDSHRCEIIEEEGYGCVFKKNI